MEILNDDQKILLLEKYNIAKLKRHEKYIRTKEKKQMNMNENDKIASILKTATGKKLLNVVKKSDKYDELQQKYTNALNEIENLKQQNNCLKNKLEMLNNAMDKNVYTNDDCFDVGVKLVNIN